MRRTIIITSTALTLAAPSAARAETTWRQVLNREAGRDIVEFSVPPEAVPSLQRHGFHVSRYDARNVVSRFSDPTFLDCAKNAGLAPIVKYGPAVAGGALGIPVNPLVGPGLDAALSAAQIESYGQCENDWMQRIAEARVDYRFEVLETAVGQTEPITSENTADILDLQNRTHDLEFGYGQTRIKIRNLDDALRRQGLLMQDAFKNFTDQARENKRRLDEIVDAQQRARKELELRADLEEKRQLVQGGTAALSLLTKLAFARDPVTLARIDTGISSMAKITDSVLQLSSGLNVSTGAKLLLSANIAGGALSLISMFGSQNGETAVMQQQLSAIRQDISELRFAMDQRLDRLEHMLIEAMQYIDQRLNNIDQRLENIEENLRRISQTLDVLYHVSRESFSFLIAHEYEEVIRGCGREISRATFSADKALDCVEKSSSYAREGANKYAISSGSLYDLNIDVDVGANIGASLPAMEQVGYMDAVLRQADQKQLLRRAYSVSVSDLVSPPDWSAAVDSLSNIVGNPSQFKAFKSEGIKRERLVHNFRNDILSVISIGDRAKSGVATMRKDGVQFALDRMTAKVGKLAELTAGLVLQELSDKDLSIVSIGELEFDADIRSTHNTDFNPQVEGWSYGVLFSATNYFYVTDGPQKGRRWAGQKRLSRFDDVQRTYDSRVPRERYVADWTNFFRGRYASLLAGGALTLEYDRNVADLRDRLPEINQPYFDKEQVGRLTAGARQQVVAVYKHIQSLAPVEAPMPGRPGDALQNAILIISPDDDKRQAMRNACDDIAASRKVVNAYAGLIRTSYIAADDPWRTALSDLPETSVDLCTPLLAALKSDDVSNQDMPIKDYVIKTINGALSAKMEKLRSTFDSADQSGGMDIFDARLRGLRNLHAEARN